MTTVKKAANRARKQIKQSALTAALQTLVTTCATAGFTVANAYGDCVVAVKAIVSTTRPGSARNRALEAAARGYKSGYVARSLLSDPAYVKRWHNLTVPQQIDEGGAIIDRAAPTTTKDDRRTEQEHKACRAADKSWFMVKERSGLTAPKKNSGNRKPRPGANEANPVPVDLVKASPKLATRDAANDYFGTAAAALLATVNKNTKAGPSNPIDLKVSAAVTDFVTAIKAALGIEAL